MNSACWCSPRPSTTIPVATHRLTTPADNHSYLHNSTCKAAAAFGLSAVTIWPQHQHRITCCCRTGLHCAGSVACADQGTCRRMPSSSPPTRTFPLLHQSGLSIKPTIWPTAVQPIDVLNPLKETYAASTETPLSGAVLQGDRSTSAKFYKALSVARQVVTSRGGPLLRQARAQSNMFFLVPEAQSAGVRRSKPAGRPGCMG